MAKNQDRQLTISELRGALAGIKSHIEQALPATARRYLTPERVTKIALMAISRQPMLMACTRESILRSVMDATTLGLELGGPLGQAYLVPYRNKNTGRLEANFIIGYRGLIALSRRSGEIQSVNANIVYEKDTFEIDLGSGEPPKHIPYLDGPRGKPRLVYSIARFKDGGMHVEMMTMDQVDAIRERSRAKNNGPWVTDYEEMARKTVVRRAAKYWPISIEMAEALAMEDRAEGGDVIDAEYTEQAVEQAASRTDEAIEALTANEGKLPADDTEPEKPKKRSRKKAEPDVTKRKAEIAQHILDMARTAGWCETMDELLATLKDNGQVAADLKDLTHLATDELEKLADDVERACVPPEQQELV